MRNRVGCVSAHVSLVLKDEIYHNMYHLAISPGKHKVNKVISELAHLHSQSLNL